MDTVLNLGLNDDTAGNHQADRQRRFAWDAYRRFVMMFSDIVLSDEYQNSRRTSSSTSSTLSKRKRARSRIPTLTPPALKVLVGQFKDYYKKTTGEDFPTDPIKQLELAIEAVFKSWDNPRAVIYRTRERISHDLGTAVNVQTMVFVNMGEGSGTGVAFTRDAATGENHIYGEFLVNAQGEDVVAGVRTPETIDQLAEEFPAIYKQFVEIAKKLENHYRDIGTSSSPSKGPPFHPAVPLGKRTPAAHIEIAVMVGEGSFRRKAVLRVPPEVPGLMLLPSLDPGYVAKNKPHVLAKGLNAGPGGAVGKVAIGAEAALKMAEDGSPVILVGRETTPDDLGGMLASKGVLTATGGKTSHAALVARQYGIPTVCGCSALQIDDNARTITANGTTLKEGEFVSIDGTLGLVYQGQVPTKAPEVSGKFATFMEWADSFRTMGIRANADTPEQAAEALELGASGIGLCRTEHMFMGDRVPAVQAMILAEDETARDAALAKLLPLQREDFVGIFKAMKGNPVTVRLIDPPLHEFLPSLEELLVETTEMRVKGETGPAYDEKMKLMAKVKDLHEFNPMLGLRGCRLSIYLPGIVKMQVAAIIGAACEVKKAGLDVHPEIMIPLVGVVTELTYIKEQLEQVAVETMEAEGVQVDYKFGTMIEIPRAALTADEIAKEAAFFSFGTNDLTQMAYGLSRDDAGKFLPLYIEKRIIPVDPTELLTSGRRPADESLRRGRAQGEPDIKLGICGEHGGDPDSVEFCYKLGLTYCPAFEAHPRRPPRGRAGRVGEGRLSTATKAAADRLSCVGASPQGLAPA